MAPTNSDLLLLVRERPGPYGYTSEDKNRADIVLGIITSMVLAQTPGEGFTDGVPNDELSAAILTASARLYAHARQVRYSEVKGPQSVSYASYFDGFSLAELAVVNRYRVRAY